MQLNQGSIMPLYQQIIESIKKDIEEGKYRYAQRIPSEAELSEEYRVSRITVRRALDELCSEGYLTKKQGKGTFVERPKLHRKIEKACDVQSFSDACRENGMAPGAHVVEMQATLARYDEQKFFGLTGQDELLYIQRLRTANHQPIMLENSFLPMAGYGDLQAAHLEGHSLFQLLRDRYGMPVSGTARSTLELVRAGQGQAALLAVPVGEPLFYLNAYFTGPAAEPVLIGRQYIVGSRFLFNL